MTLRPQRAADATFQSSHRSDVYDIHKAEINSQFIEWPSYRSCALHSIHSSIYFSFFQFYFSEILLNEVLKSCRPGEANVSTGRPGSTLQGFIVNSCSSDWVTGLTSDGSLQRGCGGRFEMLSGGSLSVLIIQSDPPSGLHVPSNRWLEALKGKEKKSQAGWGG